MSDASGCRQDNAGEMLMRTGDRRERNIGKKRKRSGRVFWGLGMIFILILVVVFVFTPFVVDSVVVETGAMSPSVNIGDTVAVNELAYLLFSPKRGDIIQFESSGYQTDRGNMNKTSYIRRIVGLPGEVIQIKGGDVYINGYLLEEDYTSGETAYSGTAASSLTLSNDEYFVMADNRSNNFDSRDSTLGAVTKQKITGKVWLKLKPFSEFGVLR